MYKISKYYVSVPLNNEKQEINSLTRRILLYSTRQNSNIILLESNFVDFENGNFDKIPKDVFLQLYSNGFIVNELTDEFEEVISENESKDYKILGLVLHSTANCQLGCSYCGQTHAKKHLSQSVKDRILEFVEVNLKTKKFEFLFLTWHGSEPLLNYSDISTMSKVILDICAKNGVKLIGKIITNGLSLKKNIFNELYFNHGVINFQITIDGSKEYHDSRRFTKNGLPTFDIIYKNICEIVGQAQYPSDHNPISIRINIDKTNIAGVYELIDQICSDSLQSKVNIDFRPVENYADVKHGSNYGFSKDEYAQAEIELFLYCLSKGFSLPADIIPKRIYNTCMALDKNFIVIDVEGNISPCYNLPYTNHKFKSVNDIGNILYSQDTYKQNVPLRNWYNEIRQTKNLCYSCNLLPICGGYCPLRWQEGEIACPSFKYNFSERLLLNYINIKNPQLFEKQ